MSVVARLVSISLLLLVVGCASSPRDAAPPAVDRPAAKRDRAAEAPAASAADVRMRLLAHYREWKGTRYRLGGMSRSGIDCSGFVHVIFRGEFARVLPRTTEQQARRGVAVARDEMQVGDLVFFRTAKKTRHVGIYLGNDQFLHASTSVGVTVSRLSHPYWNSVYWQTRRIDIG